MKLIQCPNGHYYDADRFFYCPFCDTPRHPNHPQQSESGKLHLIKHTVFDDEIVIAKGVQMFAGHDIRNKAGMIDLQNPLTSQFHALFIYVNGVWNISDLSSLNGTYLNGKKLVPNKNYELKDGDVIDFAHVEKYTYKDEIETPPECDPKDYNICIFSKNKDTIFGCAINSLSVDYNGQLNKEQRFSGIEIDKMCRFYLTQSGKLAVMTSSETIGTAVCEIRFFDVELDEIVNYISSDANAFGSIKYYIISKKAIDPQEFDSGYISAQHSMFNYYLKNDLVEMVNKTSDMLERLKTSIDSGSDISADINQVEMIAGIKTLAPPEPCLEPAMTVPVDESDLILD